MKHFFILRKMDRLAEKKWKLSLEIASHNQKAFGCKILQFSGSKTWNSLPYHIKSAKNLAPFETMIKFWNGETCTCKVCLRKQTFSKKVEKKNFNKRIQKFMLVPYICLCLELTTWLTCIYIYIYIILIILQRFPNKESNWFGT